MILFHQDLVNGIVQHMELGAGNIDTQIAIGERVNEFVLTRTQNENRNINAPPNVSIKDTPTRIQKLLGYSLRMRANFGMGVF